MPWNTSVSQPEAPPELRDRMTQAAQGWVVDGDGFHTLRGLSESEWCSAGKSIAAESNRWRWAVGDWLIEGLRQARGWPGDPDGGDLSFIRAAELTGFSPLELSHYYRVAVAFGPTRRRPRDLSWTHHRVALAAPDKHRDDLLLAAVAERLNTRALALRANALGAAAVVVPDRPPVGVHSGRTQRLVQRGGRTLKAATPVDLVACPRCGHQFPASDHLVGRRKKAPTV
jgi:hypothetical protein